MNKKLLYTILLATGFVFTSAFAGDLQSNDQQQNQMPNAQSVQPQTNGNGDQQADMADQSQQNAQADSQDNGQDDVDQNDDANQGDDN